MQLNLSTRKIIKLLTQQRIKYQTGNYIIFYLDKIFVTIALKSFIKIETQILL